ncbi:MAG TPA: phosphate signaling complex protein PhoU [Polyangiaceae bacterium]|nr:phosphate signaling complex protein PhoU [Polyangiaceae bacterium]
MTHFEETLQRDVERIRSKVREMAALAEGSLNSCIAALVQRNRQIAYSVILRDQRIDELDKEIDRLCLEFILRQQPVAGTLRFVYAAIKINSDLERVGDYAESMARQGLSLFALEVDVPVDRVQEIANKAIPMLHGAVEAFVSQDADLAVKTMETEEVVDRLRHQLSQDLVGLIQRQKMPLEALAPLMNIVNRLERVADQARNICQETLYMCTGEYMKHAGSETFRLLFVDESNSCVSQMAEALGSIQQVPNFVFSSAGLSRKPVDPATVLFLRDKGIDISRSVSKGIDQIPHLDHYQIIVALTKEAQRVFPPPPTKAVCLDWSLADPSQSTGTPEQVRAAYDETYKFLKTHIRDLVQAILGDQHN